MRSYKRLKGEEASRGTKCSWYLSLEFTCIGVAVKCYIGTYIAAIHLKFRIEIWLNS